MQTLSLILCNAHFYIQALAKTLFCVKKLSLECRNIVIFINVGYTKL